MSTAGMRRNQKVRWNGVTYQLIALVGDHWQVVDLDTDKVIFILAKDLLGAYTEGSLEYLAADNVTGKLVSTNSNRDADTLANLPSPARRNLMALRTVLENLLGTIGYTGSTNRIASYLQEQDIKLEVDGTLVKPHPYSIYRDLKVYMPERSITSLLPKFSARGNREERMDHKIIELGNAALDELYLTRNRKTKQATLISFITRVARENNLRNPRDHLPIPTLSTLNSILQRIPKEDVQLARYGRDNVRHDNRTAVKGAKADEPNERWEVDHTKINWIVVDDRTGLPIGRPWLTLIIDRYTRCIMGYHLTFESPCYSSVAAALKMAVMPKHYFNEKYPKLRGVWDQHGTPEYIGVDNGPEFHCEALELACAFWNTTLQYCPRLTPWFKGAIERAQGTLNRQISDIIPSGKTFDNVSELKGNDPKKYARVSLAMANEVIVRWIVDIYHANNHRTLKCSPKKMWEMSVDPQELRLPINPDQLALITGSVEYRKVWHYGVEINNAIYNSEELGRFRQLLPKGQKALIKYDPQDMGSIHVQIDGRYLHVPVTPDRSYMHGMSLYVHKMIRSVLVDMEKDANDPMLQAQIQEELRLDMQDEGKKMKAISVRRHRLQNGLGKSKTVALPAVEEKPSQPSIPSTFTPELPLVIPQLGTFIKGTQFLKGV